MGLHQVCGQSLVGFSQDSILGSVLFDVLINYLIDVRQEVVLSKITDDNELGRAANFIKGGQALQRDLDKLRYLGKHQLNEA